MEQKSSDARHSSILFFLSSQDLSANPASGFQYGVLTDQLGSSEIVYMETPID